jgi:uncharacterized protein with HEPN domain
MKDDDRIILDYLNDIYDSIINIKQFIKDIDFNTFQKDIKTQYAVIRGLEIIGEASKKIPNDIKENNSWIPWRYMAAMRDKLIHDYFGVDSAVVWKTATEDIVNLERDIKNLITDLSH